MLLSARRCRINLPDGYTSRPPTAQDVPAVAALIAACQAANGDRPTTTADEVLGDWAGLDLAEEAVLILSPTGAIVACADLFNRRYVQVSVSGYVHPGYQGRGLGTALVQWGEDWLRARWHHAPADARVVVQQFVRSTNDPARRLLAAHGYTHVRTSFVMEITLDAPPVPPKPPAGITLRDFIPGQDEWVTFEAVEAAFLDSWERPPGDFDRWLGLTALERRDPDLWTLAVDASSGAIVGASLGKLTGEYGWIGAVGVRRPWRGRGLALALLHRTFGTFYRRGVREIGLSVDADSITGAPRLYRRAGMQITEDYLLHRKALRPGQLLLGDQSSA